MITSDASANPVLQGGNKRALRVYKLRLRDKHGTELQRQARAVNYVWNYCNETQRKAAHAEKKWLGYIDLARLTAGSAPLLDIHAHTIQRVCRQYADSRRAQRRPWLRWRGRRSLGWVPFNTGHVSFDGECFVFRGCRYEIMHMRELPGGAIIQAGSFNADSRGRWYINVPVEVPTAAVASIDKVGIDLGLASLATLSTGETIKTPKFYRKSEISVATVQRARKTKRARAIHAKVKNRRKDYLHKASAKIAKEFGLIVVGDVSPKKLAQSRFAKSVLDAGWADFKRMLSYKALTHGGSLLEVCERNTSQTCSECGSLPASRPRGIAGLRNRIFRCDDCGAVTDRDVNAARNILAIGLNSLAGGTHV
jgi:putative transposase